MPKRPDHFDSIVPRDPVGAYRRASIAVRRVGQDAACQLCGEARLQALIPDREPIICAECDRKLRGCATEDDHHPAAEANDPTTIRVPANDHQAELNAAQYDWPKETREKLGRKWWVGSPLEEYAPKRMNSKRR